MQYLYVFNILECMWGLLCFCAAQFVVIESFNDVKFVQYKNIMSELEFNNLWICFWAAQCKNINPAKITAFTVYKLPLQEMQLYNYLMKIKTSLMLYFAPFHSGNTKHIGYCFIMIEKN